MQGINYNSFFGRWGFYSLPGNHVDKEEARTINVINVLSAIPGLNVLIGLFQTIIATKMITGKYTYRADYGLLTRGLINIVAGPLMLIADLAIFMHRRRSN